MCALPGETPCPTFRVAAKGGLAPPPQPRLVLRPTPHLTTASTPVVVATVPA